MAFIEWIQNNSEGLLGILAGLVGIGTLITGFFSGEKAKGAAAVLLKISHFFSAVSPIDKPGSLSVPLTTIDITPKEPVE